MTEIDLFGLKLGTPSKKILHTKHTYEYQIPITDILKQFNINHKPTHTKLNNNYTTLIITCTNTEKED